VNAAGDAAGVVDACKPGISEVVRSLADEIVGVIGASGGGDVRGGNGRGGEGGKENMGKGAVGAMGVGGGQGVGADDVYLQVMTLDCRF
jgi:hypothetical protein